MGAETIATPLRGPLERTGCVMMCTDRPDTTVSEEP